MRLLAYSGQRAAAVTQFENYRDLLAEELGLKPGAEARELLEEIRSGPAKVAPAETRVPAFLTAEPQRSSTFVGRERELAWLDQHLMAAFEGKGQAVFLSGEAGSGKTSLLARIARRAAERRSDLLLASGKGRAFAGVGDPYLPFRQLFEMLGGDVESAVHGGFLDVATARGIWNGRRDFVDKVALPCWRQRSRTAGIELVVPVALERGTGKRQDLEAGSEGVGWRVESAVACGWRAAASEQGRQGEDGE